VYSAYLSFGSKNVFFCYIFHIFTVTSVTSFVDVRFVNKNKIIYSVTDCIEGLSKSFPDSVDKEINNNKHKGYDSKTH
jgi:hypothetical protein